MTDELTFKTSMDFAYGVPSPISPGIVRLVANNPSPLTFKGTNTYLVGMTELMLIDPGPEDANHRDAILKVAQGRPITHILITHAHRDHVDGLKALVDKTGAKVAGFGRSSLKPQAPDVHPQGHEFIDYVFEPDIRMQNGDTLEGNEWAIEAIHTPGHAPDHLCFALKGRSVLFTGDHIMAWNTTLVAAPEGSMSDYIGSLEKLMRRSETVFLPAHGGRIPRAPPHDQGLSSASPLARGADPGRHSRRRAHHLEPRGRHLPEARPASCARSLPIGAGPCAPSH